MRAGVFWVLAVLLCWAAGNRAARAADDEPAYARQENVVYAEVHGIGLVMDIFSPAREPNGLGIVQVVSGAWYSDRGKLNDLARAQVFEIFCRRGYTVFAVRPGSISKFSAPEMVEHLEQGIRWVKRHAEPYKIDPRRLGLIGASAGGHLGSLVALGNGRSVERADDASVAAAGIFFPPADFLDYGGRRLDPRQDDRLSRLLRRLAFPAGLDGKTDEEILAAVTAICPARLVHEQAPPFLLLHGDADPLVPLQQSQVFLQALEAKKVPARLIVKPGGGHPWPTIHEEVAQLADWFDAQLAITQD